MIIQRNCLITSPLVMQTGAIICCCYFCLCCCCLLFFKDSNKHDFYNYSRVYILCYYYNTNEPGKTLRYKGLRQFRLISFQWTSQSETGLWISNLDFYYLCFVFYIVKISSQGCLGVICLECIVNPAYLIGCCDCTLINLVLKTTFLLY